MFDDHKMTQRVGTLSGGEQNRLLLAKLFAQTHNFLVLDEPTNDLDLETLELLQEVIADYDGTVLIVSHDRDFLDRTVTAVLAFEGDAKIVSHAGGYSEYLERRRAALARQAAKANDLAGNCKAGKSGNANAKKTKHNANAAEHSASGSKPADRQDRLTFKDQHALDTLPDEIARLEAAIEKLETAMADPDLFARDPDKFNQAAEALAAAREKKDEKETRWLDVAAKAEALTAREFNPFLDPHSPHA